MKNFLGEIGYLYDPMASRYYITLTHKDVTLKAMIPLHIWNSDDEETIKKYVTQLARHMQIDLNQQCQEKGYDPTEPNLVTDEGSHVDKRDAGLDAVAPATPDL